MADTCDRCYRPKATYEAWCTVWWLGPPHAVCGIPATAPHIWHRMMDDDCAAARDRWLTAEVARLQAELAEARSVDARQDVFREGFWAGRAWASAFECGGIAPDAAESWAQSDARAAAEAALGVQP